jgi:site-specific recombinase XerD
MPHHFEIEQVLKLLGEARKQSERDWLLLCVTFVHALRASEAVALTAANVVGTKLVVKRLKKSRPVEDELLVHKNPLLNERAKLIELCRNTRPNQKLFPMSARTFQRRMHTYGEAAGLPELYCHPHTLKHSVLTYLAQTMDVEQLQDRSGHVELASLGIYLHPKKAVTERLVNEAFAAI